jgi:DHA1 family bicyclomycin/chloramphenicol resistance-like MFS transporter
MFLFITIVMIYILTGVEVDLFIPSFPELCKIYNLSPFLVQITLSANFVAYCLCSLIAGTLGDRYNRRTVILYSLLIFVIGSALCVFATNYNLLIAGRVLQGIGIAGPTVISYVIIADQYPIEKQPALLGTLNGIVTLAMAVAPVIGSYVNLYCSWRGNFVILLSLGLLCLIASYFAIPNHRGNPKATLSPKAYWPLLTSKKVMTFVWAIGFLVVPYWVFIGMAPILYMGSFGIELKHFGFYQGAIAATFSIVSILSPKILNKFGWNNCLYYSALLCLMIVIIMLILTVLGVHNPLVITGMMLVFSGVMVFPINILYPLSLEVLEDAKSRTAAIITGLRLLLTAFFLELISYFYTNNFFPIGITIFATTIVGLLFVRKIYRSGWVNN